MVAKSIAKKMLFIHKPNGTGANSHVSAASCKLVPLGRVTFWMLKLVNFHHCPWCPWEIKVP